jgi:Tfp pilus assembly protein PilN
MRFVALSPGGVALGLLAVVTAAVVLLYLIKPSPRRLTVSSAVIWRRVLRERARTPDRLRWWLSLLLAVAVALMLALGLTRPELWGFGAAERVALVLDNSATLATLTVDGKTRWQHAIERARQIVRAGGAGSRYMVADAQRTIPSPRFEESDAALATLDRLRVVTGGQPVFPDVTRAGGAGVRAVLVTDGVADLLPPPQTETLSVFQPADNVGITAFDLRAAPRDRRRYQAFVEVLNASPGAKRVELRVAGAGRPSTTRILDIPGGVAISESFDVSAFAGGQLRASVSADYDALAADDVAYAYLPPSRTIRVGLVAAGASLLERSLQVLPGVRLSILPPQRVGASSDVDVWVFDGYAPERAPRAPVLMFHPPRARWLPTLEGELGATAVWAWAPRHPVTEGVSLRDVLVDRALALGVPAEAQVLATNRDGRPLILASASGPRWVEVAFAPGDSNLPLQPGFPALLSNALDWMTGEAPALRSGPGLIQVPLVDADVLDPRGRQVTKHRMLGATFFEAEEPGIYVANVGERRVRVAVNVANVTAVNASRLAGRPTAAASQASHSAVDPWMAILLAAALLLVLEWWTYNRRVTV